MGNLDKHGFARNKFWSIDDDPPSFPSMPSHKAFVDLILKPSGEDLRIWPHRFVVYYQIFYGLFLTRNAYQFYFLIFPELHDICLFLTLHFLILVMNFD